MKDTLRNWLPALKKEAELGNSDAMGILARMYRDGIGVDTAGQKFLLRSFCFFDRISSPVLWMAIPESVIIKQKPI